MKILTLVIGVTFTVLLNSVNSLHLAQAPAEISVSGSNSELEKSSNGSSPTQFSSGPGPSSDSSDSEINLKGNLNTILPNPTVITNKLNSTIQSLIQTLNSTISSFTSNSTSGLSSIIGTVKNLTSSVINKPRFEDMVEHLAANISEILRNPNTSRSSESDPIANFTSGLPAEVEGALRDFQRTITDLRSALTFPTQNSSGSGIERRSDDNNAISSEGTSQPSTSLEDSAKARDNNGSGRGSRKDSFQMMLDRVSHLQSQVDNTIQKSLRDARSKLEDSITSTTRQGSQLMRNQTVGFMNEIRRVFSSFSEPFRQFMDDVRRRVPTAVVTA